MAMPSRESILNGLEQLSQMATSRDYVIIFLSGHAVTPSDGGFSFLAADAVMDHDQPVAGVVSASELKERLSRFAGHVVVFTDTCYGRSPINRRHTLRTF